MHIAVLCKTNANIEIILYMCKYEGESWSHVDAGGLSFYSAAFSEGSDFVLQWLPRAI